MEIQGKVIAVLPIKDGVGKTSGNEWKSREFVLETEESRPQSLCLQLMNANILHTQFFVLQITLLRLPM